MHEHTYAMTQVHVYASFSTTCMISETYNPGVGMLLCRMIQCLYLSATWD